MPNHYHPEFNSRINTQWGDIITASTVRFPVERSRPLQGQFLQDIVVNTEHYLDIDISSHINDTRRTNFTTSSYSHNLKGEIIRMLACIRPLPLVFKKYSILEKPYDYFR